MKANVSTCLRRQEYPRKRPENALDSYRKRANSINLPDFTVDMFSLTGTAPLSRVDDMNIIHTVSSCHVETVCLLSKLLETIKQYRKMPIDLKLVKIE